MRIPHRRLFTLAACLCLLGASPLSAQQADSPRLPATLPCEAIAPIDAPFDMPQLGRPRFPDRVFDIRDHGAAEGGKTPCTDAIRRAIAACAEAGGGHVLVPPGEWLTGPIHLKSNVDLHLARGAEVRFSQRFEDYLPVVLIQRGGVRCYNYSPLVYARDCENVAVTGPGLLDGQGRVWWPWQKHQPGMDWLMTTAAREVPVEKRVFGTPEQAVRPPFVQFYSCRNVLLEGFTIKNGPSWTIHPVYCENVIVRRLTVRTVGVPNGDGIDPDSCRNVLIEHCDFDTGDDCVVLKAGRNEDAWEVGIPCENVVVRNCTMRRGHAAFAIGSEMSAGVRNVFVHDLTVDGNHRGIYVKSKPGRGGAVENVWVRGVDIQSVTSYAILLSLRYGGWGKQGDRLPAFRNVHIENLRCKKADRAIAIRGLPGSLVENVTLSGLEITAARGAECQFARGVTLDGVNLRPKESPLFSVADSSGVTIRDSRCPAGIDTFLAVGTGSRDVRVVGCDLAGARQPVAFSDGVPRDTVEFEAGED